MKKLFALLLGMGLAVGCFAQSKVYMTREISPEALVKVYKALGRPADGHRVAVKSVPARPEIPTISSQP